MEKAVIITAPSGAGKSTIAAHLLSSIDDLDYSVSATTRRPRKGEEEGLDYYFIGKEEFMHLIDDDAFVEWEEVYEGIFYGTLKSEIERIWESGKAVLYVVDIVGAKELKGYFGKKALAMFIEPPSMEALRKRLENRGSESDRSLGKRLERAGREMQEKDNFDVIILNDDLEMAKVHAEDEVRFFLSD
jgi:guanylate kinase